MSSRQISLFGDATGWQGKQTPGGEPGPVTPLKMAVDVTGNGAILIVTRKHKDFLVAAARATAAHVLV